jgi:Protein of unknown function (DUF2961)
MMHSSLESIARIPDVTSHAITAENPTGAKGAGGAESSALGPGRKGKAYLPLAAGETMVLADIRGPGMIRHIWITVPATTPAGPFVLKNLTLRAYWDGEEQPSIEAPLGDFFCNGFGTRALVTSIPIVVAPHGGMNSYFPMPFRQAARIELSSEHPDDIEAVFFQIDYTLGDQLDDSVGYLHAQYRRSGPELALGADHVILDDVRGRGTYVGTYIALTSLERFWWGEGEVKFFLDGDTDLPTICGTGLEDYAGGAWAFQESLSRHAEPAVTTYSAPYFGYPQRELTDTTKRAPYSTPMPPKHGMYRWHLPDPIVFSEEIRVTLQRIGHDGTFLFERADDVSSVAYWYQLEPHGPFPPFPPAKARRPR